jgi:hypothetical protein
VSSTAAATQRPATAENGINKQGKKQKPGARIASGFCVSGLAYRALRLRV